MARFAVAMYSDKGKGKGKRSDSAYLDYCVSRVDPDDQGSSMQSA